MYPFPVFPGHEGVGRVTWVGNLVEHLNVGDLVGCGIYRHSCGACFHCATANDNLCGKKALMFARGNTGTLSEYVRLQGKWALPMPEGIDHRSAGPLMCAGMTVFSPFMQENILPGNRVGVLGIGGLGHLAVKFAAKYGCITTALSRGRGKEADCKELGAHSFVDVASAGEMQAIANTLDYILVTAAGGQTEWDSLIAALAPGGSIVLMGNPGMEPVPIPLVQLLLGSKKIAGSGGSSSGNALKMLRFAGAHNIAPQVEVFPVERITDAWNKVMDGSIRYRAVVSFE